MLISEMYCGLCASTSGWEKAGFKREWLVEPDPIARKISKSNQIACRSAIPFSYRPVDFAVFYCGSNNFRVSCALNLIQTDLPPSFLIESDFKLTDFPGGYDIAMFSINASKFFVPHARIKEYCFGIRKERNPGGLEALELLVDSIEAHSNEIPMPLFEVTKCEGHFVVPPRNSLHRAVHSHLRPLPELHSKSGKPLSKYKPHESDSVALSEARPLGVGEVSKICGVSHIKKPEEVDRVSWFKWVGHALDPKLSYIIGRSVMTILQSGSCTNKRKNFILGDQVVTKTCNRNSKMDLLIFGNSSLEESCKKLGVNLIGGPHLTVSYTQGTNELADSIFSEISGISLPVGCTCSIKQRKNQTSKLEDISWELMGKTFTSKTNLRSYITKMA